MTSRYKDLPYVGNQGNACALACYTVVTQYFLPEITFERVAEVSRWQKGYVVWEMPFWNWIMTKGIRITNYDKIDYQTWGEEGVEGLRKAVPENEFKYYIEKTYNLESYTKDIRKLLANSNFTHLKRNPLWSDLVRHFEEDAVCTVVLNSAALDGREDFELHQVAILDITDTHIIFHDPRGKDKEVPKREETHEHFKHAWLEKVEAPSLSAYSKVSISAQKATSRNEKFHFVRVGRIELPT